jgi:hypothetical protein
VRLVRLMHELAQNVDGVDDARPCDGEEYQSAHKATIAAEIGKEFAINVNELEVLFHEKYRRHGTKVAIVSEDIQSIFALIKKNSSCNLKALKVL